MDLVQPVKTLQFDKLPVAIYQSNHDLGEAAAHAAREILASAITRQGFANLILATGNSQLTFLHALRALDGVDWQRINVFHMDEYIGIDSEHPASFPRFLHENIIDAVQPHVFYPVPGDRQTSSRLAKSTNRFCISILRT